MLAAARRSTARHKMTRFVATRLLSMVPVLFIVSLLTFMMIHLIPGDPVMTLLRGSPATQERIDSIRGELGLDEPLPVQYWTFIKGMATGDIRSIRTRQSVLGSFLELFPKTLQLAAASLVISILLGVPIGIVAATRQNTFTDYASMVISFVGVSMPDFWLSLMLIYLFAVKLDWVPATGGEGLKRLILPAMVLAVGQAALIARMVRSNMLEVLGDDYIKTARAKGLNERTVVFRHALQNALIPTITIIGLLVGYLLSGAVIVETIFARPGVGRLMVDAILARDYPQVQGLVLLTATIYLLVNAITDISYAMIDPRVRP
jgi:peptide/nickel transport system permease protein